MPSGPVKRTSQLCTSSNYALKTLNYVLYWPISVPHLEGLAYRIGLVRNTKYYIDHTGILAHTSQSLFLATIFN